MILSSRESLGRHWRRVRGAAASQESDSESLNAGLDRIRHEKFARFQKWQHAKVMNMLFGDGYVTIPELPSGYEAYAKWWFDNQLKVIR